MEKEIYNKPFFHVCIQQVTRKWYKKMAAGVGGLQTALILIGFIVRFQPNFNNNIEVYDVRPENLGFYACQLDIKESKFDYTIQKLCSGLLDFVYSETVILVHFK
jgi:hypothetical protein